MGGMPHVTYLYLSLSLVLLEETAEVGRSDKGCVLEEQVEA